MRAWPDTLPGPAKVGYRLSPAEQSLRTDMEVGAKRVRRLSSARRDSVQVTWRMPDVQFAAFRVWHGDELWSLAGDSDSLADWTFGGATLAANALVGPDGALADRIVETLATGVHQVVLPGIAAPSGSTLVFHVTLKAAGRGWARVGYVTRDEQLWFVPVNLTTGAPGAVTGLFTASVESRGDGWWRVTLTGPAGVGAFDPVLWIGAQSDAVTNSYAGSGTAALSVCEICARVATGQDQFLRTGADGRALGAAGGSAWFFVNLAFGGDLQLVEARFEGPFEAEASAGLNWEISGRLEVRNA